MDGARRPQQLEADACRGGICLRGYVEQDELGQDGGGMISVEGQAVLGLVRKGAREPGARPAERSQRGLPRCEPWRDRDHALGRRCERVDEADVVSHDGVTAPGQERSQG